MSAAHAARAALGSALAAGFLCACPILGYDEEPLPPNSEGSEDSIPVVDDTGPFDPSEAVDDDDGAVVLDSTGDPTDASAFADETAGEAARAVEASAKADENEREKGARPGKEGEPVADEAEAAARERERERAVERVDASGADDDEEKVELGHNPPPEPTVETEREGGKVLAVALEVLLVAVLAFLLSAGLVFARSHPRGVLIGGAVALALAAFFASQVA